MMAQQATTNQTCLGGQELTTALTNVQALLSCLMPHQEIYKLTPCKMEINIFTFKKKTLASSSMLLYCITKSLLGRQNLLFLGCKTRFQRRNMIFHYYFLHNLSNPLIEYLAQCYNIVQCYVFSNMGNLLYIDFYLPYN